MRWSSSSGADPPVPADQGAGDGVAGGLSWPDQVLHAGEGDILSHSVTDTIFAQGPVQEQAEAGTGGTLGARCQGLHPLPVMFHCVLELEPGVR